MAHQETVGVAGKLRGVALGSYGWSSRLMNGMFGDPTALRPVNPTIASGLELLGFVGVLGLGRMYAGDIAGGVRSLVLWLCACLAFLSAFAVGAMIAVAAAFFTLGISLGIFALVVIPVMIPFALTPIVSATKLYRDLSRM